MIDSIDTEILKALDSVHIEVTGGPSLAAAATSPASITITNEMIDMLKSDRGGWSRKILQPLGVSFPLVSGWKKSLVGKTLPLASLPLDIQNRLLAGSGSGHSNNGGRRKPLVATAKQVAFLVALGMGQTAAERLGIREASEKIEELKRQPTEKQIRYAKALGASNKDLFDNNSKELLTALIDRLKGKRKR